MDAACRALRGAAQCAQQACEEERRLRKGAEAQVARLLARAKAASPREEGEDSLDARSPDKLKGALLEAEAMNAALLEDVDATAVVLDDLRAQNASLIEGSGAAATAYSASLQHATARDADSSSSLPFMAARKALETKVAGSITVGFRAFTLARSRADAARGDRAVNGRSRRSHQSEPKSLPAGRRPAGRRPGRPAHVYNSMY